MNLFLLVIVDLLSTSVGMFLRLHTDSVHIPLALQSAAYPTIPMSTAAQSRVLLFPSSLKSRRRRCSVFSPSYPSLQGRAQSIRFRRQSTSPPSTHDPCGPRFVYPHSWIVYCYIHHSTSIGCGFINCRRWQHQSLSPPHLHLSTLPGRPGRATRWPSDVRPNRRLEGDEEQV